jgi:hypothetical protein
MESDGLLPCSQEPATGPYPEPGELIPHRHVSLRSISMLVFRVHLGLPSGLFPSGL